MLDWDGQEKTEQPTQARREEARRRGQIPRSIELTVAFSLLAGFCALYYLGPWMLEESRGGFRALLAGVTSSPSLLSPENLQVLATRVGGLVLIAFLPVAACTCCVAAGSALLQLGFSFRPSTVWPDPARVSVRRALRRVFNVRSVVRGGLAALKLVGVGVLLTWILLDAVGRADSFPWTALSGSNEPAGIPVLGSVWLRDVCTRGMEVSLVLVAVGVLDYLFQRWQHERDLRMTRTELEEEIQRSEGSRELKSRRRRQGALLLEQARGDGEVERRE